MVKIKSVVVVSIGFFLYSVANWKYNSIFVTSFYSFYFKKTKNSHNAFKVKLNLVKQMFNICDWFSLHLILISDIENLLTYSLQMTRASTHVTFQLKSMSN